MRVSQQIGWSQESKLIYNIIRQLEKLEIVWDGCCAPTTTTTTTSVPPGLTMAVGNSPRFDIAGEEDFTIEWFAKMADYDGHPRAWSVGSWPNAAHAVSIEGGVFYYWIGKNIVQTYNISGYSILGNWTHFCIERSAGIIYIFINGTDITSGGIVNSDPIPTNGYDIYIGSEGNDSVMNTYMSNFRWNNTAVYSTSGFTPPTTPLTSISGTQLLILQGANLTLELTDNSGVTPPNIIANSTASYFVDNPFIGEVGCTQFGVIYVDPPTAQATSLSTIPFSASEIALTWSPATFPPSNEAVGGYILLRAEDPDMPVFTASDGQAPSCDANTTIVYDDIFACKALADSKGLSALTTYNFMLIPFTWDGANSQTYNYLIAGAPTANGTTTNFTPCVVINPTATGITGGGLTPLDATLGATITSDGGDPIVYRGTLYSTGHPVGISDNLSVEGGTTIGTFSELRTSMIDDCVGLGLPSGTKVYYKAYATNSNTIATSPEAYFIVP